MTWRQRVENAGDRMFMIVMGTALVVLLSVGATFLWRLALDLLQQLLGTQACIPSPLPSVSSFQTLHSLIVAPCLPNIQRFSYSRLSELELAIVLSVQARFMPQYLHFSALPFPAQVEYYPVLRQSWRELETYGATLSYAKICRSQFGAFDLYLELWETRLHGGNKSL